MTPDDLARLTEESAPLVRGQYPGDVEFLTTRLALARRVVEAARVLHDNLVLAQAAMPEGRWFGRRIQAAMLAVAGEIAAHDAEAKP